jgi:histidinol dehydrogenase
MKPIHRLATTSPHFAGELARLTAFEEAVDAKVRRAVDDILDDVRARGDAALLEHTARFDRWQPADAAALKVPASELEAALASIPAGDRAALQAAAERIRRYHEHQVQAAWSYREPGGTVLGQQVTPLDRVGLYVPGGKAAYPSSVLMNAITAKVAGVPDLVMVSPTPDGILQPHVLAAAAIAGVDTVLRIGGAQAIAALAYGTASIAPVDKIVGPGNAYVAAAKRRVFGTVGIDMVAGPSEILIIADGSTPADWVAMDLFSQAEHDELAQAILVCPDSHYLDQVGAAMLRLLPEMPRRAIITASLERRGAFIQTRDLLEACEVANRCAPEHLELSVADARALLPHIRHAGAIFIGRYATESLGDYCAGPNHVLPTARTARFSSPLGVPDFQKRSSLIEIGPGSVEALAPIASTLARAEGLLAHARAAEMRLE